VGRKEGEGTMDILAVIFRIYFLVFPSFFSSLPLFFNPLSAGSRIFRWLRHLEWKEKEEEEEADGEREFASLESFWSVLVHLPPPHPPRSILLLVD